MKRFPGDVIGDALLVLNTAASSSGPGVDLKTHIPERGVVVSTVGWNHEIGMDRTAETMAFPAGADGKVTNWGEIYFESHGMHPSEASLRAAHGRIVAGIRDGSISLYRSDGEEPEA